MHPKFQTSLTIAGGVPLSFLKSREGKIVDVSEPRHVGRYALLSLPAGAAADHPFSPDAPTPVVVAGGDTLRDR